MVVAIVTWRACHDGNVRLGLRHDVECEWELRSNEDVVTECATQGDSGKAYRGRVPALLRRHRDNLPVDELDVVAGRQDAGVDHPVVFRARPSPQLHRAHNLILPES